MRRVFGLALLAATLLSTLALDRPLILVGNYLNRVQFPNGTDALWLATTETNMICPVVRSNDVSLAVPSDISGLLAARHRVNGQWSSVYMVRCFPGHRGNTNQVWEAQKETLTYGGILVGEIGSTGVAKIPFKVDRKSIWGVEALANRIGSQLDPVIRILDPAGIEVASNDDSIETGRDAGVRFKSQTKGIFTIEIRDVANGSGPNYFFALRGTFPGALDSAERFVERWHVQPPEANEYRRLTQPANSYSARFLKFGDRIQEYFPSKSDHQYQFSVKEDARVIISAETRLFGSPADAGLALTDANGKVVGESVGSEALGASLTNELKKGTYHLKVRELSRQHGLNMEYWLSVRTAEPGVLLSVESDRIDFSKEGEVKLKIACRRFNYDGPIKFRIDPLPGGVSLSEASIDEKKNEGELKLKADRKIEAFNIRITGEIEQKGTKTFPVSTMPALRKLYPLMLFPPSTMDGWIAVNPPN